MLADVADKVEEGELAHPVVVVDEDGGVGGGAVEVEELAELLADALLVVTEGVGVEEVAFLRFAGGVADHAGGAAEQHDGAVAALLQVLEHHHTHEVPDMEGVGGRVNADVGRSHFFLELFLSAGHHVVNHPAPFQFFSKIHCIKMLYY